MRAYLNLLDHYCQSSIQSFKATQAIIIALFILVNLEGITVHHTSIISQAIFMACEISLHHLDHPNYTINYHTPGLVTITKESGRRLS